MAAVEQRIAKVDPIGRITRRNLAEAWDKSPKTLCEWAAKGKGPRPFRVGGRIYYWWKDAETFSRGEAA